MEKSRQANLKIKLDIANDLMAADHHQSNRLVFQMIELSKTPNMRFEIFTELLMELKNYAFNHYAREESFMEMCDYPQIAEHRASHKLHLVELSKVLEAVRKGDQPGVNKLMLSIFNGWQKHRGDQDKKLIDYIHTLNQ
ncbi:MAG: hemerythrin domain-containing protein [Betaproteobacteria bacterium]